MSNFIDFPGMKPINLDFISTITLDQKTINFIPGHPNAFAERWKFYCCDDAVRVYRYIMERFSTGMFLSDMEGTYNEH